MKAALAFAIASLLCLSSYAQEPIKHDKPIRVACPIPFHRIVKKVQPLYPPLARQLGVQGKVRLRVLIARDGTVKTISVMSGHPLLIQSATDAIAQWQYKPLLINEKPIEEETIVTVVYEQPKEELKTKQD